MTQPSSETTAVTAEIHYRTTNWDAYASEMEQRGVELGSSSFEFHAKSDGGDVTAEASVELKQKAMLSQMTDAMVSSLDPKTDAEALKVLRAFERSEFRTARMDMNMDEGTVTVEGGAKFDNFSALSTALGDSYGGMNVASVAGRTNDGETTTYVRVEGLVSVGVLTEDAKEEDVRALAVADSETTIYLPGEWDREFPSMDTANVSTYLGVEQQSSDSDSKTGGQPGFGIGVAVAALAGVALLARRD
ncbi:PGF-CTERM sorting domain-containing protein [Haladaptatus sp. NG-SE-30]